MAFGTLDEDFNAFNIFIGSPGGVSHHQEEKIEAARWKRTFLELTGQVINSSGKLLRFLRRI